MLNNITNFFNLIKSGMTKTQLESSDLLPIGTRDGRYGGNYKPATIKYSDLVAGLVGGSNGQVLFNDSDTIAGANNFYFNKTTNRVGIGTSTPGSELHIDGHTGFGASLKITTDKTDSVAYIQMVSNYVTGFEQYQHGGPGWGWPNWTTIRTGGTAAAPTAVPNDYGLNEYTFWGHDGTSVAQAYSMMTRAAQSWTPTTRGIYTTFNTVIVGAANLSERMRFTGTGNLQVNNNLLVGTSTDAGYKLDVNGTFRASDSLIASSSGGGAYKLTVQQTGVGQGNTFRVIQLGYSMIDVNTNSVTFMPFPSASGTVGITSWTSTGGQTTTFFAKNSEFTPQGGSQAIPLIKFPNSSAPIVMGATATADLRGYLTVSGSFNATSGLGVGQSLLPTLTATANNDVLVGLDIQPTFTNGAFTGLENIPLRLVSQSNSNVVKNILLKNIGTGNGSGVSIGFNNLNANNLSHAFIKSYYVVPSGMAMSFGTGGGSSLTSEGTTALVLNADQTANFTARVIANSGGFQAIGTSANMLMSDGGTPVITRNGSTGIQFLKDAYWQTFSIFTNNTENLRVASTGNVLINTTTDAGYKLDVNGTARVQGDLSVPTGKITFQTSAFGIDCNTTTGIFDIKNTTGSLQTTRISFSQGTYLNIYQPTQSSTGITSGIINTISTPITYAWSSGTAQSNLFVLNPTINNTGSYSGTFRGFYYNPTLTSMTGTTHFAIHTTAGRVRFEGLPTSSAGLSSGDIWNDGGTLKIV